MDNTETDLRETGCGGMDWTDLAEDREQWRALVNTVINHLRCMHPVAYRKNVRN
jgi:hypothetical protein